MPNRIWVKRTEVDANGKKTTRVFCCRSRSNTCGKAHLSYAPDLDDYGVLAEATRAVNAIFDKVMDSIPPGRELSLLMAPGGVHFLALTEVDEEGEDCICGDLEDISEVAEALSLEG